jgi:hypothetical protein
MRKPAVRRSGRLFRCSMYKRICPHLILCLAFVQLLVPRIAAGQGDSVSEYELKAAMLYNLTRFVEWPASAYPNPETPTQLCILGRDPFGNSLASIVSRRGANSRPVQIRHLQNGNGIRACHVLYISSSEKKNIGQIISLLKGSDVLTVGEMAQFAARGGMIQFSLVDRQVRFDINLQAASQADLKISSRLLVLARIVTGKGDNPDAGSWAVSSQSFEFARVPPGASQRELCGIAVGVRVAGKDRAERRWSA